jgi:hypothetical protein
VKDRDTLKDTAPVEDGTIRITTESADDVLFAAAVQRVKKLEDRADRCDDRWAHLQGVDATNGRLGRMDRTIQHVRDELVASNAAVRLELAKAVGEVRADVGDSAECKKVREAAAVVNGMTRRTKVVLGLIVSALFGGAGYLVWQARDKSIADAARIEQRLHQFDVDIDRLYEIRRAPRPDPTRSTP